MVKPNARLAAIIEWGEQAGKRLDAGLCPRCGSAALDFRDRVSKQEYLITGLCQACQDHIFRELEEE